MRYLLGFLALGALYSFPISAKQFEIVKEHSKIAFDIDYMMMTKVDGKFKDYLGFFELDERQETLSNIKVTIVGESVDTNDAKRDFHLRGHEFFFVANYPEITFFSKTPVKISEGKTFKIAGDVTIRGITKPLSLEGIYKGKRKDPWGKDNYFFELSGAINRKDFDIVWNKEMDTGGYLVGDVAQLKLSLQAQAIGEKTAFSTHMVPHTRGIQERSDLKKGKIKKLKTATDPYDHKAPKK